MCVRVYKRVLAHGPRMGFSYPAPPNLTQERESCFPTPCNFFFPEERKEQIWAGAGGAHQDKCFLLLEPGQAQGEELARSLREAWAARCRKAETQRKGWGRREVQRQRPETRVPRDDGVGAAAGEKETRRDWEQEREMETRRDCPEKERQREKEK